MVPCTDGHDELVDPNTTVGPGTILHRSVSDTACLEVLVVSPKIASSTWPRHGYWTILELGVPRLDANGAEMGKHPFTGLSLHLYDDAIMAFGLPRKGGA